jgi:hypothetical protein
MLGLLLGLLWMAAMVKSLLWGEEIPIGKFFERADVAFIEELMQRTTSRHPLNFPTRFHLADVPISDLKGASPL